MDRQNEKYISELKCILFELETLQEQDSYTTEDVTMLQEQAGAIEAKLFPGKEQAANKHDPKYVEVCQLLHNCYKTANTLHTALECPDFLPLIAELEGIKKELVELKKEWKDISEDEMDSTLRDIQKSLHEIENLHRKNGVFHAKPDSEDQRDVLPGQSFLHSLLEGCYQLVHSLQTKLEKARAETEEQPQTEEDPSVTCLQEELEDILNELQEELKARSSGNDSEEVFTPRDLRYFHERLRSLEEKKNEWGIFFGDISKNDVPKGQGQLHHLLHQCYRTLHFLDEADEVDPQLISIARELEEVKARMTILRESLGVTKKQQVFDELEVLHNTLSLLDRRRSSGSFGGPGSESLAGQPYLHALLQHCYSLEASIYQHLY
eukprot:CAMPEP_0174250926 /NCGR_PEP_ID=MMETSP0439-20130205/924_1 /TAXON_ID=0 /ORGANISM="Stereomyxa ramosa, Strain Chinc5" /LENGTH=378 /DNA_ID=CAMNT_0015331109 /DNA_START=31 /DNA_END=1167 /DNA_ORIENTATION=-